MTTTIISFARRASAALLLFILCVVAIGQNILTPKWGSGGWVTPNLPPQYSHDGSHILVASVYGGNFQAIGVYNVANGGVLAHLEFDGHNGNVTGACLSADGKTLYYGTDAGVVFSYVIATQVQALLNISEGSGNGPRLLAASHDGKTLGYVDTDPTTGGDRVGLYNLSTNAIIKEFDYSNSVAGNTTSSFNFCNADLNVVLDGPTTYDFTGKQLGSVPDENYQVTVSPDEKTLYTYSGGDSFFHAYSASSLTSLWAVSYPSNENSSYIPGSVSSDGKAIFFPNADSTHWYVNGLATSDGSTLSSMITAKPPAVGGIPDLVTAPNVNQLLLGPETEPSSEIWNFNSGTGAGTLVGTFFGGIANNWPTYILPSPLVAKVGGTETPAISIDETHPNSGNIETIRNTQTGAILGTLGEGAVVSPDGSYYVLVSGATVNVYSVASGKVLASYTEPDNISSQGIYWAGTTSIVVSDGSSYAYVLAFSASADSLSNVQTFTIYDPGYRISPDGTKFAAGDGNGGIEIYNVATGASIGNVPEDGSSSDGIDDMAFSTNSRFGVHEAVLISSGEYNSEYRVFDISTSTFKQLQKWVFEYAPLDTVPEASDGLLSPDGETVIMSSSSNSTSTDPRVQGTIVLYSVSSGKIIAQWNNQFIPDFRSQYVNSSNIAPNGNTFAFSSDSSTVMWTTYGAIVAAPTSSVRLAVSLNPTSVPGGTSSTGTVTISPAPTTNTTVTLSSGSTSATVPASVTIAAGKTSATFTITTVGVNATTTAAITASGSGASASANLTITAATSLTLSFSPSTVPGGTSSTGTVKVNAPAGPSGIVVSLSSANTAVVTVPSSVTIPANKTSVTFTATTKSPASNTTVAVTGKTSSYSGSANLTVDAAPVTLTFGSSSVTGGTAASLTVTLQKAAPSGGATYTLKASNGALSPRASVTVPGGKTSVTIGIPSNPVLTNTAVTLAASANGAVVASASITVDAPVVVLVLPSSTAAVGPSTAVALVVINGPAPSGFKVTGSTTNSAVKVPATIPFTTGQIYAAVPITISAVSQPVVVAVTIGGVSFNFTVYP